MNFLRLYMFGFIAPAAIFALATVDVSACSCETYGVPRIDAKQYYGKEFRGAIFTGTIKKIIHDPGSEDGGITFSRLLIEVDQYWLGVHSEAMTVLAPGPNTSCWFNWKVNQKDFFIAAAYNGNLYLSFCDQANWGGDYPQKKWMDYTNKILGKPKSFPKKVKKLLFQPGINE